jgi:predicted amidophosphoribosyltransferase
MPQDVYCGICGTKLEEIRKCPSCEYTLFLSDRFCRACGKAVAPALDYPRPDADGAL